jgi:hypothetical protein
MGLTESKIKDLEEKKFDRLYAKHEKAWLNMVKDAYEFAKAHVTDGNPPRPDDVQKLLLAELEVSKDLRNHQEDHKARFKHFREYFGEYIIDKYFQQLNQQQKKAKEGKDE